MDSNKIVWLPKQSCRLNEILTDSMKINLNPLHSFRFHENHVDSIESVLRQ